MKGNMEERACALAAYIIENRATVRAAAKKFGVSKSPVREALVELCKDGVLINIPRMGYQVRAVTLKEIMDILKGLHNEGRTVILITHDNDIAAQAKRVIKIKDGKVESDSGQIVPVEELQTAGA